MIPVMQTKTGLRGNCYAACLASVLEIPLETLPGFFSEEDEGVDDQEITNRWWERVRAFLRPMGYGVLNMSFVDPEHWKALGWEGHAIVSGPSPRLENAHHATVWKDGVMVHDPHPDQTGIKKAEFIEFIYKIL